MWFVFFYTTVVCVFFLFVIFLLLLGLLLPLMMCLSSARCCCGTALSRSYSSPICLFVPLAPVSVVYCVFCLACGEADYCCGSGSLAIVVRSSVCCPGCYHQFLLFYHFSHRFLCLLMIVTVIVTLMVVRDNGDDVWSLW